MPCFTFIGAECGIIAAKTVKVYNFASILPVTGNGLHNFSEIFNVYVCP